MKSEIILIIKSTIRYVKFLSEVAMILDNATFTNKLKWHVLFATHIVSLMI